MKKLVALCALAVAVSVPAMAGDAGTSEAIVSGSEYTYTGVMTSANGSTWQGIGQTDPSASTDLTLTVNGKVETFAREWWQNRQVDFHFNGTQAAETLEATLIGTFYTNHTAGDLNFWVGPVCKGAGSLDQLTGPAGSKPISVNWLMKIGTADFAAPNIAMSNSTQKLWLASKGIVNDLQLKITATSNENQAAGNYTLDPDLCMITSL